MREVEVLCLFSPDGLISPFRFRTTLEDGSLSVVKISKILFRDEDRRTSIIKFRCECVIQNRKQTLDMFYNKNTLKWYINR